MGRKHRTYPESESKERQLRKKIKEQEKEIERLKSELKTLNKAFNKTAGYIKDNLDNVSVEKVIKGVKKDKSMKEIREENTCPDCGGAVKYSKLPFGSISICLSACGYREVKKDSSE